MTQTKQRSIIDGPILPAVVRFAIPLIIASIISDCFQIADTIVLAKMGDLTAVASISAIGTIISLVVTSLNGFSHGAVILLAKSIGAGERDKVNKILNTAVTMAFGLGTLILLFGVAFYRVMPSWVNTPAECDRDAALYLLLYFCNAPALLLYNFAAAAIRARGDSLRPAVYIVVSGIVNVGLNILLCLLLPNKVLAVSLATMASHVVAAVMAIGRIIRIGGDYHLSPIRAFDLHTLRRIVSIGLPCALSSAMFSIGTLPVSKALNGFSPAEIAGASAAAKVQTFVSAFYGGFSDVALTFVGQNYGAGKRDRMRRSFFCCLWLGVLSSALLGGLAVLFRDGTVRVLLAGNGTAAEELEYAVRSGAYRTLFVSSLQFIDAAKSIMVSTTQALGHTLPGTVNNILTVLVFRNLWILFVFPPHSGDIRWLYGCYSVSWILSFLVALGVFLYYFRRVMKPEPKQKEIAE